MKSAMLVVLAIAIGGCSQAPPINTVSGKPDVLIKNVEAACVKEAILNQALTTGWDIKGASEFQITLQRQAPTSVASVMLSTGYGPPYQRVTFNLVPSGGDLRVVADMAWVSNVGTPYEQVRPARGNVTDQATLEAAAARSESKCAKKG